MPIRKKTISPELQLLDRYIEALRAHGVPEEFFAQFDLENRFYWLFRLSDLLALAYRKFDEVNRLFFQSTLQQPTIIFCKRATGGYYHYGRKEIGISLPMTIEHGEPEFFETLLHEIAHMKVRAHSPKFYEVLRAIGGTGRKAPMTVLLEAKRKTYQLKNYPILVACPSCGVQSRYRTRRALHYACKRCCNQFAGGKFDPRFKLKEVVPV